MTMTETTSYLPALPEIFLLIMSCAVLMLAVFCKPASRNRIVFYVSQLSLVVAAFLSWQTFANATVASTYAFHHTFVLDRLSVVLKVFISVAMVATFWYSHVYNEDNKMPVPEFYVLGLLSTLGMFVLVSSANFVTLFLGLELMSLPIYAMVAFKRSEMRCVEAAMKYFITGSVASAMLLYGLSLFFGATQSMDLSVVAKAVASLSTDQTVMLSFALIFVIAGVAFKLGAVPFHSWVPDVYDGAPNSVTLLISAAPKLAAYGLAIRFLVDTAPTLHIEWQEVLLVIALLSIALGNLVAVIQTNIKRMLAYSSIAHIGYMTLGLACGSARGDAAALFYMVSYALTSLGAFGMILLMSKAGFEASELSDFSGLNDRNPWLAFMMLLVMFSLAGIPPMVGFIAKVSVLEALIKVHHVWTAVVAIVFAIVGAYYYIRVVKVMYFEEGQSLQTVSCKKNLKVAITINGLAVLLLGIFPSQLFLLCHQVF